jgi:hypothetical protein
VRLFDCTVPGNCSIQAVDFRSGWESTIPTAALPMVVQPATPRLEPPAFGTP